MKKILIVLISATLLNSSCIKDNGKSLTDSTYMEISYQDKSGNDLLNSQTQGYFDASNIHVFKMVDGIKKEVNRPMADYPHDFLIFKDETINRYYIRVFLDNPTYLQLSQNTMDTLTCEIYKSHGNRGIKNFYYNGKLYWDDVSKPQRITIIK
ncbi:MAG: hypothetical protein Q8908_05575 [Bacteroidota bacterium]|nr:hypothetical protein [Bacteroidota bacterium]